LFIWSIVLTIVVGNSNSLIKVIHLPEIHEACTTSVMLVDFITNGQKAFFKSRQWLVKDGLVNATIALGNDLELINSMANTELITKKDTHEASWSNFVKFVITVNSLSDKEIYRFEGEYVKIPDVEVENTLQLANSQFSGNCDALLSFERFLTFAMHKNPVTYTGKSILISGCGTGAEALICMELGAKCCVGYDIDQAAIEFATKRFRDLSGVSFTSNSAQVAGGFDLIISRHVLEHVPRAEWKEYLTDIANLLAVNGEILIDVPNQNNPREPHTDLLFFHLLESAEKNKIVEYCESTEPAWYLPIRDKMKALINHRNVKLEEILGSLPVNLEVKKSEFIDMNCENYNRDDADSIRIVLKRV
jgi:2-polyprenyl-3-methyl-5-hydroxy-6-metoxy-1,4-benzoquinol methylase